MVPDVFHCAVLSDITADHHPAMKGMNHHSNAISRSSHFSIKFPAALPKETLS